MLCIGDMRRNIIQHQALLEDPYIYPVKFVFYCICIYYQFQPDLVLIIFHIVHIFLSLNLTMFA